MAVFLYARREELMVLATIHDLCVICRRLLLIIYTQQTELKKLGFNSAALDRIDREVQHLEQMLKKMEE